MPAARQPSRPGPAGRRGGGAPPLSRGPFTSLPGTTHTHRCCPHKPEGSICTSVKTKTTFRSTPGSFLSLPQRRPARRRPAASKAPHLHRASLQGRVPTKPAHQEKACTQASPFSQQRCVPTRARALTLALRAGTRGSLCGLHSGPLKVRGLKVRGRSGLAQAERTAPQASGGARGPASRL